MTHTEMFSNPIGYLNEFCQKTVTPFPIFNIINKKGPDHSPMFFVECLFKEKNFEGFGCTIKKAKEDAAYKAVKILKNNKKEKLVSFKLIEINDLESFWNGEDSNITICKKEEDVQQFKTFIISKKKNTTTHLEYNEPQARSTLQSENEEYNPKELTLLSSSHPSINHQNINSQDWSFLEN